MRVFSVILPVIFAAAALAASWIYFPSSAPVAATAAKALPSHLAATMEGFEPGADVSYKIIMPQGAAITGHQQVGAAGTIDIPSQGSQGAVSPRIYDFSIQEKTRPDPINLTFTLDPGKNEMSLLGEGFDTFSTLAFKEGGTDINTKADWAGIIRRKISLDENKTFQLAFAGNNLADAIGPNPRIVKVFFAPGGGGPTGAGLNVYSNLYCETLTNGTKVPSTCWDDPMKAAGTAIVNNYVTALIMMSHQLSAAMMHAVWTIGPLLDAKQQLETQRELNRLVAQAHKDYHPSDQMCRFGSFVKSIPEAEVKVAFNKQAMNTAMMEAYTNVKNGGSAEGYALDVESRIRQFRRVYCDPRDNNDGLAYMCEHDQDADMGNSTIGADVPNGIGAVTPTATSNARKNKDIDYTRTADFPLTLDIDFTDATKTNDEEDVLALARNLYWPDALGNGPAKENGITRPQRYMDARNMYAMANVAHNSFIEIAAMKSRTDPGLGSQSGWNFMKSLMREFGLADADINKLLGDYPSYYAQMEVLTKKIYQSPDFYTNLYDKPANVKRILASMDAIQVMQQRDALESRLRQEMLTSLLVEQGLAPAVEKLNASMPSAVGGMK